MGDEVTFPNGVAGTSTRAARGLVIMTGDHADAKGDLWLVLGLLWGVAETAGRSMMMGE